MYIFLDERLFFLKGHRSDAKEVASQEMCHTDAYEDAVRSILVPTLKLSSEVNISYLVFCMISLIFNMIIINSIQLKIGYEGYRQFPLP